MVESSGVRPIVLPEGTVTFLFTDIEGSTQLLDRLRERYEELISCHHTVVRQALAHWNGREIDTQGDAFFAAFPKATDAVNAVVNIQRALNACSWPEGVQVQVRMGLHTGEPWLVQEGYMGMDVHRAARIGHVGYGGQVLLSETTTALVLDDLPEGVSLLDLGRHRLKDMRRPESIHQLAIVGLPAEFPPIKSVEALPAGQPSQPGVIEFAAPRKVGPNPYRGLAAFHEEDAELFFGRETFIAQLTQAVNERQLVAIIVGPSGSGKSSAVFAGLLPQLRNDDQWLIIQTRPGNRPFQALASALSTALEDDLSEADRLIEAQKLAEAMRSGELSFYNIVTRALARNEDTDRALLIIDQFEELFTQRPDPEIQRQFLDELITAAEMGSTHRQSPLVILLTLRADFMSQALTHRSFSDALQEGSLILGPMNREELQAVVEKPAEIQGAAFEAGLVQRILDDVGEEPGNLPLMEFALTLLWDRMERGWMTHAAYDQIGRVDGALARYAEQVWNDLDETEREGAHQLFIQLVQPGEGTEDTRRVAKKTELAEERWSLIQYLADRRLVVTGRDEAGDDTVEVIHEALIRSWGRLVTWMKQDRAFRTWQEGLRTALRTWEITERDDGALLRGAPLAVAFEWAIENETDLSTTEKEFIDASQQESLRREAQREARRQRELETAQQLAKSESTRAEEQAHAAQNLRRRAYILAGVLALAAVLAVAALFFAQQSNENATLAATREVEALAQADRRATAEAVAVREQQIAEEQRHAALVQASVGLASQALLELEGNQPERAVPLALEAIENYPYTWQAERALARAVSANHLQRSMNQGSKIESAMWSPDGSKIVTSGDDGKALLWEASTGQLIFTFQHNASTDRSTHVTDWSPNGNQVSTIGADSKVRIWNVRTGDLDLELDFLTQAVNASAWSPSGDRILSANEDGTVKIWDAETGAVLATKDNRWNTAGACISENRNCTNRSSPWSPSGDKVVTYDRVGGINIWDPVSGEALTDELGHSDYVNSLLWSPDGSRIVSASDDGTARIWDAATGEELIRYAGENRGPILSAQWSPDGDRVLINFHLVPLIVVFDAYSGEELVAFAQHSMEPWTASWSEDGTRVLSGAGDGTARIWDSATGQEIHVFRGHTAAVRSVAWSPSEEHILTGSYDGVAKVWQLASNLTSQLISGEDSSNGYSWSPTGDQISQSYRDGSVDVFDADTGVRVNTIDTLLDGRQILFTPFAPNGQEILVMLFGEAGGIWNTESGERIYETFQAGGSFSGAWSPDGTRIAIGFNDGLVKILEPSSGRALHTMFGHEDLVTGVSWLPDGDLLATTSAAGEAKIWDVTTGEILLNLYPEDYADSIRSAAWSPDGSLIATYSNGVLSIWNPDTGENLQNATGLSGEVYSIFWFPKGDRILAGDGSGEIVIWDVSTGFEVASISIPGSLSPWLSPDGGKVLASGPGQPLRIIDIWGSLDELVNLARECCLARELTPDEREQFGLD